MPSAYACGEVSGTGPAPFAATSNLGPGQEPLASTPFPTTLLPGAALPPAPVRVGEAKAGPPPAASRTLVPDKQPEQVNRASFVEGRTDQPASENRPPTPAALPTIVNRPLATSPPTTPPSSPAAPATPEPTNPAPVSAPVPAVVDLEPPTSPTPLTPGAPILRVVNSRRITLNFELKDGSSAAPGVDLWATRDMRTWKKQEAVRASAGSHLIEVREEGLYGFTLIARSNLGPQPVPHSGDLPQVWVTVDATPPVVQLAGVELSLTTRDPALVVRWKATDRNFNRRPITISYCEQLEGPWVTLAAGVENTGRWEVPVPANLPKRLYVRVEAHDVAGNVGRAQTTGPILLPWAGSVPTVQASETPNLLPPPPTPEARPQVSIISVDGTEPR